MAIPRFLKTRVFLIVSTNLLAIAIGYAVGAYVTQTGMPPMVGNQLRTKDQNYPYISPLIACISPDKSYFGEYKTFEKKLSDYIREKKRNGDAESIGVYVRDLGTGHWAGVGETSAFFPASLFKVPIMISYLKQADTDSRILQKKFVGRTVQQLLESMITESDNTAKDILLQHVNNTALEGVLNDLEINSPDAIADNEIYTISPRKYSLLFRVLYSATLVSKPMSNYALSLLTKTNFANGIVAPLPREVPVAHKYGVHGTAPIGDELHDCGIVYRSSPYFLCVMTKGNDVGRLEPILQDISRMVYSDFVSSAE